MSKSLESKKVELKEAICALEVCIKCYNEGSVKDSLREKLKETKGALRNQDRAIKEFYRKRRDLWLKFDKVYKSGNFIVDGFMSPVAKDADLFLVEDIENIEDTEEKEYLDDAINANPFALVIRLSAKGYMDCTNWTVCATKEDIEQWFDDFCEHVY